MYLCPIQKILKLKLLFHMTQKLETLLRNFEFQSAFWQMAPIVATTPEVQPYFCRLMRQRACIALLSDDLDRLRTEAKNGNPYMKYAYARYHDLVVPDAHSNEIKEEYYLQAYHEGVVDAGACLAFCYRDGDFGEADVSLYHQTLKEALEKGSVTASHQYLRNLIWGLNGVEKNVRKAYLDLDNFIRANEKLGTDIDGIFYHLKADAAYELGEKKEAAALYRKAIEHGDASAFFYLAIYTTCDASWNVLDRETFMKIMSEAREANSPDGFLDYAILVSEEAFLHYDEKTKKSISEAVVNSLELAISMGDDTAAMLMGTYYAHGSMGLPKDLDRSWAYFARGAVLRNTTCLTSLADRILNDQNAPKGYSVDFAYECLYKALMLGDEECLEEVIDAYRDGFLTHHAAAIEHFYIPRYIKTSGDVADFYDDPDLIDPVDDEPEQEQEEDQLTENETDLQWKQALAFVDEAEDLAQQHLDDSPAFTHVVQQYLTEANQLKEYTHLTNALYSSNQRMLNLLSPVQHKSLRLGMLLVQEDVLTLIEAHEGHDLMILDEVREEIEQLQK